MVHLRAILAIVRKDALDIWLDKTKLIALAAPLALTLLWLVISDLFAPQPTPPTQFLVYNPSHSPLQQVISGVFPTTRITNASSPRQVAAAFAVGSPQYDVGLVIPAGFEASLKAGSRPQVSLYLNSSVSDQEALLQAAVSYYARTVVTPTSPVSLVTSAIKPPPAPSTPTLSLGSIYANLVLPISFGASMAILPGLLIEEKEKKTLRMLMVSPASFADVLLGKVLVVFIYQMALSLAVLGMFGAFASSANVPLLLLYMVSGVLMALSIGLFIGSLLDTAGSAGLLEAVGAFAFIIPAIFVPLTPYMNGSAITQIIKILPTYYVAEGVYNALNNLGSLSANIVDMTVILGTVLVIFFGTLWRLRRQAQVAAVI